MLLLLSPGVAYRVWQLATGQYFSQGAPFVIEDLLSLAVVSFGLIGLWGYAKKRSIFNLATWRAYFVLMVVAISLAPLASPKYAQLAANEGTATMLGAFLLSTVLVLPAMWAWYSYAFKQPSIWASASVRQA